LLSVVSDVDALHQEDDVLGDVGGVVADALEVAGDEDEVENKTDFTVLRSQIGSV
jgi:hypothetical protein